MLRIRVRRCWLLLRNKNVGLWEIDMSNREVAAIYVQHLYSISARSNSTQFK